MKHLINLYIVGKMDLMIRAKATGGHEEFAENLGIGRSTLFDTIKYLREEMNAPIVYNKHKKTFEYEYIPKFFISFDRWENSFNQQDNILFEEIDNKDDLLDDGMEAAELEDVFGKTYHDDWDAPSLDNNSDIILNDDINFRDLFPIT